MNWGWMVEKENQCQNDNSNNVVARRTNEKRRKWKIWDMSTNVQNESDYVMLSLITHFMQIYYYMIYSHQNIFLHLLCSALCCLCHRHHHHHHLFSARFHLLSFRIEFSTCLIEYGYLSWFVFVVLCCASNTIFLWYAMSFIHDYYERASCERAWFFFSRMKNTHHLVAQCNKHMYFKYKRIRIIMVIQEAYDMSHWSAAKMVKNEK